MVNFSGETLFTSKEAYTINLPKIDVNHEPHHHIKSLDRAARKVAMELVLCDNLIDCYSKLRIPTTNMFVLFKQNPKSSVNDDKFQVCEDFEISKNCSQFQINIETNKVVTTPLSCCKDLQMHLKNSAVSQISPSDHNSSEKFVWYQSLTVVKGFKDKLIKGESVLKF